MQWGDGKNFAMRKLGIKEDIQETLAYGIGHKDVEQRMLLNDFWMETKSRSYMLTKILLRIYLATPIHWINENDTEHKSSKKDKLHFLFHDGIKKVATTSLCFVCYDISSE